VAVAGNPVSAAYEQPFAAPIWRTILATISDSESYANANNQFATDLFRDKYATKLRKITRD
jgi:hypothetical protein